MNISLIMAKVSTLRFHPEWVDGGPGLPGPVIRTALTEYVVAGLIRDIGVNLTNREVASKLHQTARELVARSSKMLPISFETELEPDDLCPPYWRHFPPPPPRGDQGPQPEPWRFGPSPEPWLVAGPHPEPWLEASTPALKDIVLAVALRDLASVTSIVEVSAALKEIGETIMKQASSRVFDEYCGTTVKPHVPVPRPKATAA